MKRYQSDEWLSIMDELNAVGWVRVESWKLRLWFGAERISQAKWKSIIAKVENSLPLGSKVLGLYNEAKSTDALFLKAENFKIFSSEKNHEVVEQLRAWTEDLKG